MRKPSGNLIIAGQTFKIDAPVINFREPPFWDATREVCQPTATDPAPKCLPGGVPYGKLPRPYTKRWRGTARPRSTCPVAAASRLNPHREPASSRASAAARSGCARVASASGCPAIPSRTP